MENTHNEIKRLIGMVNHNIILFNQADDGKYESKTFRDQAIRSLHYYGSKLIETHISPADEDLYHEKESCLYSFIFAAKVWNRHFHSRFNQ